MAKKPTPSVPLRLSSKTFFLDKNIPAYRRGYFKERIRNEGGTVATAITPSLSYLLLDPSRKKTGRSVPERAVAKANAGGASIEVIDTDEFLQLVKFSQEEALTLLRGDTASRNRFRFSQPAWATSLEYVLEDCDLRGIDLERIRLKRTTFVNADFRKANLTQSDFLAVRGGQWAGAQLEKLTLDHVSDCKFDGLCMVGARLGEVNNSSFRKTDLSGGVVYSGKSNNCDYSEANLSEGHWTGWEATKVIAVKVNLSGCQLDRAHLAEIDLTEANLSGSNLEFVDLSGAKLNGANLTRVNLSEANLQKADLRGANLTHAILTETDLTGAKIKGADFTEANLRDAKLDGLNLKSAKGLGEAVQPFSPGPNLQELDNLLQAGSRLELRVAIETDGERTQLTLIVHGRNRWTLTREESPSTEGNNTRRAQGYTSVGEALHDLAKSYTAGKVVHESIFVKVGTRQAKKHEAVALRGWYEALGRPFPTEEELQKVAKKEAEQGDTRQQDLIARLRKGQAEVEAWNAMKAVEREAIPLSKIDLSNAKLPKIQFSSTDLCEADFSGADLEEAVFYSSKLRKANFQNARLVMCQLQWADCTNADFKGANLHDANLTKANLRAANLQGTDLSDAQLHGANLRAADLTGANLTGAKLFRTKYDSKTKFPAGFTPTSNMKWMESSPSPTKKVKQKVVAPVASIPFTEFMEKLPKVCRRGKIDNAVRMLKAERFQLYAQVEDDHIVGVVRSQSSSSRVYACRLDADGTYSCGTQNLRACGGLQGSPCKHLLVLLIGLAKADQLDSGKAYQWIESASKEGPTWDKDDASETFLKYKGAEAGEVDWRPTETIPEDFYAL